MPPPQYQLPQAHACGSRGFTPNFLVGDSPRVARPDARAFINEMAELVGGLGLERTLREVGVQATDLERLATDAVRVEWLLVNNAREVT